MFGKNKDDTYFSRLIKQGYIPADSATIAQAIDKEGFWADSEEWRISTYTDYKISKIEKNDEIWFKVEVKCDHEFTCHCPTLDRAIEMTCLYSGMISTMFYQIGWPSWVSINQLNINK
ncbi:MAG: hypothetical protein OEY19_08440 [Gammaproteobacteria bacterium]|nr:hypothetical protein [Gammaproteobacteria bacterium]MDH5630496.1 hypothetical protein [Gammaproteobacteria bacterium]